MSKLKIEKGASKVRRAPLKTTIDGTVADDLALMCEWSENDLSYLVNVLLGFAIGQSEDFQRYKAGRGISLAPASVGMEPVFDASRSAPTAGAATLSQFEKGVSA